MRVAVSRRQFVAASVAAVATGAVAEPASGVASASPSSGVEVRRLWLQYVERVAEPVMRAMQAGALRQRMPVEAAAGQREARALGSPLEALGRLLAGLAPWLEQEPGAGESVAETALRQRYREAARAGIAAAVDPAAADYMRFGESGQTLVDTAFLALAMLRARKQLLGALDTTTQQRLADAMTKVRVVTPPQTNWLLFAALTEVLLQTMGRPWEQARVDDALAKHDRWYLGDGTYGDGPQLHVDYYNSYVIHPFLLQVLESVGELQPHWHALRQAELRRATRYAAVQERMIGSDGTYPLLGRSITYRCGAFHLLADAALRGLLPEGVQAAQVRGALTAVMQRTLGAPGTLDAQGWLQIGVAGHQPHLGESYISTGSLYLCSAVWLPLGLPASHAFWTAAPAPWSAQRAWGGEDVAADHALDS
ncbi:MAG: DUF2264 domain-containing protein [Acidobacteriota bacterium]|nr:DUF2264 domain-containing protein [Acidobacteriota bacterium]